MKQNILGEVLRLKIDKITLGYLQYTSVHYCTYCIKYVYKQVYKVYTIYISTECQKKTFQGTTVVIMGQFSNFQMNVRDLISFPVDQKQLIVNENDKKQKIDP